ncbi:MAG: hypothetical protein ACK4NC_00880 [Candidatus Gracilibacteria bacterium]
MFGRNNSFNSGREYVSPEELESEKNTLKKLERELAFKDVIDIRALTGARLENVFELTSAPDVEEREAKILFPDATQQAEALVKAKDAFKTDLDTKNQTLPANASLMEVIERYVFNDRYLSINYTALGSEQYIIDRIVKLSSILGLEYPKLGKSLYKTRTYKIAVDSEAVEENIGINAVGLSKFDFKNQEDYEKAYAMLRIETIRNNKLAIENVDSKLQKDLWKIIENDRVPHPRDPAKSLRPAGYYSEDNITEFSDHLVEVMTKYYKQLNDDISELAKRIQDEMIKNGYDLTKMDKPLTPTLVLDLDKLKKANDTMKNYNKIMEKVMTPLITKKNFAGSMTSFTTAGPTGAGGVPTTYTFPSKAFLPNTEEQDKVKAQLNAEILTFTDEAVEKFFSKAFGKDPDAHSKKANDVLANKLRSDANNGGMRSTYIRSPEEAENLVKILTKKDIHIRPGAWFKFTGLRDPKGAAPQFEKIVAATEDYVELSPSGKRIPLHVFAQYLIDPEYGTISGKDVKIEYIYDGQSDPIDSFDKLASKLGVTNGAKSPIRPGAKVIVKNEENQTNEVADEILSIDKSGNTITLKYGGRMSYEEFYLHYSMHNWKIFEDIEEFNRIEGVSPKTKEKGGWASISTVYNAIVDKIKEFTDDFKKKDKIKKLEAKVHFLKEDTGLWKAANKELGGEETKAVDERIDELKADFPKGGEKRKGLLAFMKNPPDMNTFKGRVEIKAWLELTLKTFGTLYPIDEKDTKAGFTHFEKNRFWIGIFSTFGFHQEFNGETYYAQPTRALDDAAKKDGPVDARVEYNTLFQMLTRNENANRVLKGAFGGGYAGKIGGLKKEGDGNIETGKADALKATRNTTEVYKVVSETIQNQEWAGLITVFDKLAQKGYSPEQMFNLFLYLFDKVHYVENNEHMSKIPFDVLQNVGKKIGGAYPVPFFGMFTNTTNFRFFSNMIYNNPIIKDRFKWTKDSWKMAEAGGFKVPANNASRDLYKFFMMRDNEYDLLRGFSEDGKKDEEKNFKPGEAQFAEYRKIINGVVANARYDTGNLDIDKNNWAQSPLLMLSEGFGKIVTSHPMEEGEWQKDPAKLFFDAMLKEYGKIRGLSSDRLPEKDKEAIRKKIAEHLWSTFWYKFKWNEDSRTAASRQGIRVRDLNRDKFIKEYGKKLKDLGLDYDDCMKLTGNEDEKKGLINHPDDGYPFAPANENQSYYNNNASDVDNLLKYRYTGPTP